MTKRKGSANKRTLAWREYLLSREQHPLAILADIARGDVERRAASEIAPYLESGMPVAIEMPMPPGGMLVIEGLNSMGTGQEPIEIRRHKVGAGDAKFGKVGRVKQYVEGGADRVAEGDHGGRVKAGVDQPERCRAFNVQFDLDAEGAPIVNIAVQDLAAALALLAGIVRQQR